MLLSNRQTHIRPRLRSKGTPIVTWGLVGRWKLDDASATIAVDSSGNRNDGSYVTSFPQTSPAALVPPLLRGVGPYGRGFNGAGCVVAKPTSVITGSFTVSAWARPIVNTAVQHECIVSTNQPSDFAFVLNFFSGTNIYLAIGNGSSFPVNNTSAGVLAYSPGTWYNIIAAITPTSYALYANGVSVGSGTFALTTPLLVDSTHTFQIGQQSGSGTRNMIGNMSDVRVYNRTLTTVEIAQIAAGVG